MRTLMLSLSITGVVFTILGLFLSSLAWKMGITIVISAILTFIADAVLEHRADSIQETKSKLGVFYGWRKM